MALHLITGYAGAEHVTANDYGTYQMATYSAGEFILNRGKRFAASIINNNSIKIEDGEAMMQGRYIKLAAGTTEEVNIESGSQGKQRHDLICIRYERNASTGIETTKFVVVTGVESETAATDPEVVHGNITDGSDLLNEMPLFRVVVNGLSIQQIDSLAKTLPNMMDNEFVLVAKEQLIFENKECRIDDSRITANSIADVYFTTDSVPFVEDAGVYVDTYDGYLVLTVNKELEGNVFATIFVRVVI